MALSRRVSRTVSLCPGPEQYSNQEHEYSSGDVKHEHRLSHFKHDFFLKLIILIERQDLLQ